MSTTPAFKVLLSAYQCGPGMGSVSQIGWEWYSRLARKVCVTLITHARNRPALARAGAPIEDSEIIFIDTEWFAGPLYRTAKWLFPSSEHAVFMLSGLDYFVFDFAAVRALKLRMQRGASWDVAHMVTPVTTLAAGRLHRLGMPVIKGPLNNGIANPSGFASLLRDDHPWLTPLRNLGKIADGLAGSTRNSAVLLTATAATLQMIPPRYRQRCISMLENAVDLDVFVAARWPAEPSRSHPLHALFVGRLVPFKALSLLLHAITRLRQDFPLVLTVIGDGPMDAKWRREAVELGVQDIVDFRGACNLDEVAAAMRDAHVFCLPSIRESGGAVLLEAMASARPVIAVGFGGPAELIDERVGKAVRPDGIETVIAGFADALRDVWLNPDAWRRRGEEGRRRAEERFCWEAKIDRTVQIYETLAVAANPGA